MLDKIIIYSFYLLFFLTTLFWTSLNHELFEFNKMFLTYGFTVIIVGAWFLKIINRKSLIINRTPLDIPLLLFLGANILSTIFSIDTHTSIWGYYSRLNGGLLSLISYLLLYWAFVSNMDKEKVFILLKFALASGVIVSLWGILEHFGVSPSCVILRGEFNASCWVQDVQARVFASLGQPNWMAGYLAMLISPALYFFLSSKNLTKAEKSEYENKSEVASNLALKYHAKNIPYPPRTGQPLSAGAQFSIMSDYFKLKTIISPSVFWFISLICYYLAFTFTYSRGPTLGLIGGFIVFILFSLKNFKKITPVLLTFILINLLFGSALTDFKLISKFAPPPRPAISLPASSGTQLETGGTESGQIRLIVWQGALDIFKNYPIFGSGLETFAYSYYQFRPVSHNLTSEWDFLYNKAHNEYLNYLATTGIVGFGTYILIIGTFAVFCIRYYVSSIKQKIHNTYYLLLATSLLASYVSYLIYNFFLFSVVIIALFFYLFPALAFVATESTKVYRLKVTLYTNLARGIVLLAIFYLLFSIFQLWYADSLFAKGEKASDLGNAGRAYNLLTSASDLNQGEPFYRSELGFAAAQAASALSQTDATLSADLTDEAILQTNAVFKTSPKNISFYRTAVRTYFELASLDEKYFDKTLEALDMATALAPTDPKLYYNKGLVLLQVGDKEKAKEAFEKAVKLKPNYQEAIDEIN